MKIFHIKTYKLKIVTVAILAIPLIGSIFSCKKDFLTAEPELTLPEGEAFANPTRILAQVNGLYFSIKSGAFLGGRYLIYNDIRAEEFSNRTSNGVTGLTVYQGTNVASDTYIARLWSQGYITINRVNLFLKGMADHPGVVTQAVNDNYVAEAKFLRALSYFSLIQIFAKPYLLDNGASRGMPLRLLPETSLQNNSLKSSSVAAIYAQILKDLNEAETGLPNTQGDALTNTTRAHKNTAIALKTRVYLAMGKYDKVIEEGNKLVSQTAPFITVDAARVGHALQANIVNVFAAPYTTSESILSFPFADTNIPGTQNQLGYYFNVGNGNLEYSLNITGAGIYADPSWRATDVRKTGLTATSSFAGRTYTYPTKFKGISPFLDAAPVIRYAEVLLNLAEAEALNPGGNLVRSRALLDAVRKRSDPTYDFGVLATSAELLAAILKERRIEFLTEGMRYNDLARRVEPIPSFGAGSVSIPVTDPRYTFPIPLQETNTNPEVNNM